MISASYLQTPLIAQWKISYIQYTTAALCCPRVFSAVQGFAAAWSNGAGRVENAWTSGAGAWYNKGAGTSGRKEVFIMFAVLANFLLAIVAGLVANQLSKWLNR